MSAVLSFVFKRRIGRLSFAIVAAVLFGVEVLSAGKFNFAVGPFLVNFVGLALLLAVIYRLHDLGLSGWCLLAVALLYTVMSMLLPTLWPPPPVFEFLVIAAFLSLLRGQPTDNEWGTVPWPGERATQGTPESCLATTVEDTPMTNEESAKPEPQVVGVPSIKARLSVGQPTVWQTYSFAPEWFEDALREAQSEPSHGARRRGILFAVCAAESYLLEWTRDEALAGDFEELNTYFPPDARRGIGWKWKKVSEQLAEDGVIQGSPDFGGSVCWQEFQKLVKFRDGLVHARSSRPQTAGLPKVEVPVPSKSDLDKLPAGWAVKTVVALIEALHQAAGTPVPDWLKEP